MGWGGGSKYENMLINEMNIYIFHCNINYELIYLSIFISENLFFFGGGGGGGGM